MVENNELQKLYEKLLIHREKAKHDLLHSGEPPNEYDRGYVAGLNYTFFEVTKLLNNG